MGIRDVLENVDFSDRSTQIALGGGAVALGFVVSKLRHRASDASASGSAPVSDLFGTTNDPAKGQPGVIGWVGDAPGPRGPRGPKGDPGKPAPAPKPKPKPKPKPGTTPPHDACGAGRVFRQGRGCVGVNEQPSAPISCPPGYLKVKDQGRNTYRCSAKDDRKIGKDQPATFHPGGKAGEAFSPFHSPAGPTPVDTNPYGQTSYGGRVGSVFPRPFTVTGRPIDTVLPGESVRQFAGRVYGDDTAWSRVASLNGLDGSPGEWQEGMGVKVY